MGIVSLSYTQTLQETSTWVREERKELTGLVLKNFQTSVSIESNGAMSARVTMEDCLLDDLRPTTVEEEEEEEEEEDEELQPESSVDAVDVGETFREQRISRYSIIIIAHWFSPLRSLPFFFPSFPSLPSLPLAPCGPDVASKENPLTLHVPNPPPHLVPNLSN